MNVFITGVSAGLGLGLAEAAQKQGESVYGCSRRPPEKALAKHVCCDLSDFDSLEPKLLELFSDVSTCDLAILNAGQLGEIKRLDASSLDDLQHLMNVNLWANKIVVDILLKRFPHLPQVVFISSGASQNGNAGWGGYSLSKAALNMLAKLYASENPNIHFSALAPGLIDTAMQVSLCEEYDSEQFPSLQRLRAARGTDQMPKPLEAGERIWRNIGKLREHPSGSYLDIRGI